MLKYIALVSLCTGAGFAADFLTGQAARAVVGQPTFTSRSTLTVTTTTSGANNYVNFSGASKTVFGAMGGIAYANNRLFVTEATAIGFQPSLDRVLIFNNINTSNPNGSIPSPTQDIPPFSGRCPVCVPTAAVALTTLDSTKPGQVTHYNETDASGAQVYPAITAASFRQPTAVASNGTIMAVADTLNNRILIWNNIPSGDATKAADTVNADVVLGQADFTTVAPLAVTASAMRSPQGVWIQGNQLFVADTGNNRILIWNSIPTSNNKPADLVLGQPKLTTVLPVNPTNLNLVATNDTMLSPTSVTSDGKRVIVSDLGYSRVLIWNSLPTRNQQPADVEIGQLDFTTTLPNDTVHLCESTLVNSVVSTAPVKNALTSTVTWVSGSKFPSSLQGSAIVINGVTYLVASWTSTTSLTLSTNASTQTNVSMTSYPGRCGKTLNFPRFALSDGTRLFIADTGNDRVLVYGNIPVAAPTGNKKDAPKADVILGQIDEFTDPITDGSTIGNPFIRAATDATETPTSLAWDPVNQNLYVSDPNDFRVTVFSPGQPLVPLSGIVNAASRAVFATGGVIVGGTIRVQDTATITIGDSVSGGSTDYPYTIKTNDTLDLVAKGLATLITGANGGLGDPNVFVTAQNGTSSIQFFARKPGPLGNNVTLATAVGPTAANAQISLSSTGSNLAGGASAGNVAPGTLVLIQAATNATNASAPLNAQLPFELGGIQVYFDGIRAPLFQVSPTQIGAQVPWETFGADSVSAWIRTTGPSPTVSTAIGIPLQTQNPGIFACDATAYYGNPTVDPNAAQCLTAGSEPRAAIALHASNFSSTTVSVDGGIQGGDTGTITIATRPYIYTVQEGDSLAAVRDGLIELINNDPGSPLTAQPTGEFTRIRLTAKIAGTAGSGITVATSVGSTTTSGAQLSLTLTHPTTCCFSVNGLAGQPVTLNNPAIPGETLAIFAAGMGLVAPEAARVALADGAVYQGPPNTPRSDVSVNAGGGGAIVISSSLGSSQVGVYQIVFELSSSLNPNPFAQLTISQGGNTSNIATIPIATPSAVRLTLTPDNTTIASGTAMNITVAAIDQYGNPANSYTGTLFVGTTDTAATLPGNNPTVGGGGGVFAITFKTTGTQRITVTDILTGITGTSGPITVQ